MEVINKGTGHLRYLNLSLILIIYSMVDIYKSIHFEIILLW
jgi:hypothetical protein